MAIEGPAQPSQARKIDRINSLRRKYMRKFAIVDEVGGSPSTPIMTLPSSSAAQATETPTCAAQTTTPETVANGDITEARFISTTAEISQSPYDVATKTAPASQSPAQMQRRDSKTAPTLESAALPTPPASTTDKPEKISSCAQIVVFGTAELFETILLELRIQNILVNASRVCREWKRKIDGSRRLQEALYFRPLPGAPVEPRGEHLYEKRKRLPGEGRIKAIEVLENPLMPRVRRIFEKWDKFRSMKGKTGETAAQRCRRIARENAFTSSEASWRRMLAYQPPVLNLDFEHDTWINIDAIENRRGLTMRDTAGDGYVYWRIGCHPITDLYRNMRSYKRARNVRRLEYDAKDEPEHSYGWEARCVQDWELDSDEESG
ncbi:hypothetical protein AC579_7702 [Pseudocercospora musae]|uniref:F-box domain-containing protein n=1 Tax=Pseudocercospora musae TaxID=113226 RepID=A0A139ITS9_9PEZI|nr:hypothetical protein AC579_7702 [Pseudocercospora musae]